MSPGRLLIGASLVVGLAIVTLPFLHRIRALTRRTTFDLAAQCWRPTCGRDFTLADITCPKCGQTGHIGMVGIRENGIPGQFFRCFACRAVVPFPQCPSCSGDARPVFLQARLRGGSWKELLPIRWRHRMGR